MAVHAYDEWSPLEEVIVGAPYDLDYRTDATFRHHFHERYHEEPWYSVPDSLVMRGPLNDRLKEECLEDLDGLISVLHDADVTVRRPDTLTRVPEVRTPDWSAPMGHAMMVRDNYLIVGGEIIETTPTVRARYFEADLLKELFTDYFRAGARWTVAPRSRLLDRNLDYSYMIRRGYTGPVPDDVSLEIMFEGAQCVRLGRDIIFNVSTENHRLGAQWLARHLGGEFDVHVVAVTDNHIDAALMPLRPGVMVARTDVDITQLPPAMQRWDVIRYERFDKTFEVVEDGVARQAAQSVGLNVLSLDEERVVVQDIQAGLIRDLEKAGFTPIPVRWRHGRVLGGGIHCSTLDVRRRAGRESYL